MTFELHSCDGCGWARYVPAGATVISLAAHTGRHVHQVIHLRDDRCPCGADHEPDTARSLGIVCGRCGQHTGNNHQGHYWGLCKVLLARGLPWQKAVRKLHFCCPDDCSLERP